MGLGTFLDVAFLLPLLWATLKGKNKQITELSLDPASTKKNLPFGSYALMTQIIEMVSGLFWASD